MNLYYPFSHYKRKDKVIQDNIRLFKETRKEFKDNNLKFLVLLDRKDLKKCSAKDVLKELEVYTKKGVNPSDFVVAFDNDWKKKTFDKEELKNLVKLTDIFQSMGVTIGVYDYKDVYDYHQVFNADKKIKEYANEIRKNDYSPLEKLMHAYFIAQSREYKYENDEDSSSKSRSVYGILNSDKVVCVGYSELLKSVIQEVGDENVRVFANDVGFKDLSEKNIEDKYSFHQNNIVYIKDEKYDIDGYYYLDPTWDTNIFGEVYGFEDKVITRDKLSHFLIEISQIKNVYKKDVVYDYDKSHKEYRKLKDKTEIDKTPRNIKDKSKNYVNIRSPHYYSITSREANFNDEEFCEEDEYDDETLNHFLNTKKDYKEYLAFKQTEKYASITKNIGKAIEKNLERAEKEPDKMSIAQDGEVVWEYLNEHSPHITIDKIQNSLNVVLKKTNPTASKDQISKVAHLTLKDNLEESKQRFVDGANTALTEVSMFKE